MARAGRRVALALTVLATVAADRLSKEAATRLLTAPREWLGGLVRLSLAENRGAFLSFGGGLPEGLRFSLLVAAVGLALLGALVALLAQRSWTARRAYAAAVALGGGLANWLDRLADGSVTDFLVVAAGPLHTGVFNLADVAILAAALVWLSPTPKAPSPESPSCGA